MAFFSTKLTGRFEPSNNVAEYTDYPKLLIGAAMVLDGVSLNNWDNSDARSYVYYAVGQSMVEAHVPSTAGSTDGYYNMTKARDIADIASNLSANAGKAIWLKMMDQINIW